MALRIVKSSRALTQTKKLSSKPAIKLDPYTLLVNMCGNWKLMTVSALIGGTYFGAKNFIEQDIRYDPNRVHPADLMVYSCAGFMTGGIIGLAVSICPPLTVVAVGFYGLCHWKVKRNNRRNY